jgi:RNA polymerase sigma-70 factor (ECF subfamily)
MDIHQRVLVSELLAAIAQGDRSAFRTLYGVAGSRLFAICLRMLRDREEAEDVLQEALVKIWQKSYLFDPAKGDGLAWVATVARNCALDRLRRPGRASVPIGDVEEEVAMCLSMGNDVGEGADLRRCLDALRTDYRKVIVLSYVNGLTHEDLAAALGRPMGTIKSWIRRGMEQLKTCLERQ